MRYLDTVRHSEDKCGESLLWSAGVPPADEVADDRLEEGVSPACQASKSTRLTPPSNRSSFHFTFNAACCVRPHLHLRNNASRLQQPAAAETLVNYVLEKLFQRSKEMSETHHFELQSQLTDQVEGDGNVTLTTGVNEYGVPSQFGGNAGKTSPEELLLAAISSCFSMTLGFVLEKRKVPARLLGMHAEGIVNRVERQLVLTSITLKPQVTIGENEQTRQDVNAAIERAEQACLISNAIRGNVELNVEVDIVRN